MCVWSFAYIYYIFVCILYKITAYLWLYDSFLPLCTFSWWTVDTYLLKTKQCCWKESLRILICIDCLCLDLTSKTEKYSPFHKSSLQMHWISIRFNEMGDTMNDFWNGRYDEWFLNQMNIQSPVKSKKTKKEEYIGIYLVISSLKSGFHKWMYAEF